MPRYLGLSIVMFVTIILFGQTMRFFSELYVANSLKELPAQVGELREQFDTLANGADSVGFQDATKQQVYIVTREQLEALIAVAEQTNNRTDYLLGFHGSHVMPMRAITLFVAVALLCWIYQKLIREFRIVFKIHSLRQMLIDNRVRELGQAPAALSNAQKKEYLERIGVIAFHLEACNTLLAQIQARKIARYHPLSLAETSVGLLTASFLDIGVKPITPWKSKISELGRQKAEVAKRAEELAEEKREFEQSFATRVDVEVQRLFIEAKRELADQERHLAQTAQTLESREQQIQQEHREAEAMLSEATSLEQHAEVLKNQALRIQSDAELREQEIVKRKSELEDLLRRVEAGFEFTADGLLAYCVQDEEILAAVRARLLPVFEE